MTENQTGRPIPIPIYTEPGCYADGAAGHDHIRAVLGELVRDLGDDALADELDKPMSDDAGEEEDALDLLNASPATADGLVWVLDSGDLVLAEGGEL